MNGLLLGVAMLVSSTGASPPLEPSRAAVVPAIFSFDLQASAFESLGLRRERRLSRSVQATSARRFSKADRVIAVAAGVSIGWVVGGAIGYAVTPKRGPDDDTSGLKGVIIGAPIGAVVGALIGYRLTK